ERLVADQSQPLTPDQKESFEVLGRLYDDYAAGRWDAPAVTAAEREGLRRQLGWFGDLALAPVDGDPAARGPVVGLALRTAFTLIGAMVGILILLLVGFVGLVVVGVGFLAGWLRGGLACGSNHGGVYAETFALWMILFVALERAAAAVATEDTLFLAIGAAM